MQRSRKSDLVPFQPGVQQTSMMQRNRKNDLVPFQPRIPQDFVQSLLQNDRNAIVLHNDPGATITIPSDYRGTGAPVGIYNPAGGNIQLQDVSVNCAFCGVRFDNKTLLDQHNWAAFKRCSVHKMCFDNWGQHNKSHQHTVCGMESCSDRGTNYGSNRGYLDHHWGRHQYDYDTMRNRIGRGFCSPCYWQHAYSHDKNVSRCKG